VTAVMVAGWTSHKINAKRPRGYSDEFVLTPEDLNMPYEEVQFFAEDGVSLTGWFIPQSSMGRQSKRVLVCCHPYNHTKSNLLGVARGFWEQRYSVFMFDFRSFAHNPTQQSIGFFEQRDARAAVQCAVQLSPTGSRAGIMGASMGGAISLIVGHEEASSVVGIAADCAFESLHEVVYAALQHQFPMLPPSLLQCITSIASAINPVIYGYQYSDVSPVSAVATGARAGQVPLLLVHAEDDEVVPISHAHTIHQAAVTSEKELVVVQHCHHVGCFFQDRPTYMKKSVEFFDRAFAQAEMDQPKEEAVENGGPSTQTPFPAPRISE
jgi:esterase/lipase